MGITTCQAGGLDWGYGRWAVSSRARYKFRVTWVGPINGRKYMGNWGEITLLLVGAPTL